MVLLAKSQFPAVDFLEILLLLLSLLLIATTVSAASTDYSRHCNAVVEASPASSTPLDSSLPLAIDHANVNGGDTLLARSVNFTRTLDFYTKKTFSTQNQHVFKVEGILHIRVITKPTIIRRGLRLVHYRPRSLPGSIGAYSKTFLVDGFWDSVSGKLCMISSGKMGSFERNAGNLGVVLKLDYLNVTDIRTSLVNGTLESLDKNGKNGYFDKVSILGVNRRFYSYTLVEKAREENGFGKFNSYASESLGSDVSGIVNVLRMLRTTVDLVYKSDCEKVNCDVFGEGDRKPKMLFRKIDSLGDDDENVRFLLRGFDGYKYRMPLMPSVTFISEGKWDREKKRLDMVGCRILSGDQKNGFVGDCSVRLSLRMPSKWSLTERSAIVGEMWSNKRVNESGYFGSVELRSTSNGFGKDDALAYKYTVIEKVRKLCAERELLKGKGGNYPNPLSIDMRFDMMVTNKKGDTVWGYSSPLTVGDTFFSHIQEQQESQIHDSMVNVSFVLTFGGHNTMDFSEISAEGLYNPNNGQVCMIGCKHGTLAGWEPTNNSSLMDCDILIHFQYAPLNSTSGASIKGNIESTRKKSDPLYFQPHEISSHNIYEGQSQNSIWRMDVEITMVLISNTLACVFVGFQLFYVKRNPGILPSISIIMLLILTLGHLIPLLLNFEALFLANRNRADDLFLSTDGWLEVNEVLVRVITMTAFLLESRLLQITWSSRNDVSDERSLWPADKKVLYFSVPIYLVGGAIAWSAHLFAKSQQSPYIGVGVSGLEQQSLWGGLRAYGTLIVDSYLLPQFILNVLTDSKEKCLSNFFYVGTTVLRMLPHIYDLYRSTGLTWSLTYIYANPRTGYYSTGWDIIISGGGLVLVLLIFLQQKYGGRCFLPKKYSESSMYEMVAVG